MERYREYTSSGTVQLERWTMLAGGVAQLYTLTVDGGQAIVNPTPTIRYQYRDHLGSSTVEANELGQVISLEEYHPYGTTAYRASDSAADLSLKRYRFTDKEKDEETGLYYFGVRYYAAWLGRWTSADPGGFVDGLNLYRYVRNNPVNGVDPDGYQTDPPPGYQEAVDNFYNNYLEQGYTLQHAHFEGIDPFIRMYKDGHGIHATYSNGEWTYTEAKRNQDGSVTETKGKGLPPQFNPSDTEYGVVESLRDSNVPISLGPIGPPDDSNVEQKTNSGESRNSSEETDISNQSTDDYIGPDRWLQGGTLIPSVDAYKRRNYQKNIKENAAAAVGLIENVAEPHGNVSQARDIAVDASQRRIQERTKTQSKISTPGRMMSQNIEGPVTPPSVYEQKALSQSDNAFDAYKNMAYKSGTSNTMMQISDWGGKYLGPVLTVVDVYKSVDAVVEAPEDKKVQQASEEMGGFIGGMFGGYIGNAIAGVAVGLAYGTVVVGGTAAAPALIAMGAALVLSVTFSAIFTSLGRRLGKWIGSFF